MTMVLSILVETQIPLKGLDLRSPRLGHSQILLRIGSQRLGYEPSAIIFFMVKISQTKFRPSKYRRDKLSFHELLAEKFRQFLSDISIPALRLKPLS